MTFFKSKIITKWLSIFWSCPLFLLFEFSWSFQLIWFLWSKFVVFIWIVIETVEIIFEIFQIIFVIFEIFIVEMIFKIFIFVIESCACESFFLHNRCNKNFFFAFDTLSISRIFDLNFCLNLIKKKLIQWILIIRIYNFSIVLVLNKFWTSWFFN